MDHQSNTAEGWDATVQDYDGASELTSRYARCALDDSLVASFLKSHSHDQITLLDVAGGTGALSIQLGEIVASLGKEGSLPSTKSVSVIASDFSPKMIEIMARKVVQHQLQNVLTTRVLNGLALDLPDNSVDYAFSNFGLFLFPDRPKGFSEFLRVLKSGGKAVITSWKAPLGPGIFLIVQEILKLHAAEQMQQQQPQETPSHPFPSKPPLSDEQTFREEMEGAGFKGVKIHTHSYEWRGADCSVFTKFFRTNPMMVGLLEKLGASHFEDLSARVLKQLFPTGQFVLQTEALVGTGVKRGSNLNLI